MKPAMNSLCHKASNGFTLIEMVISITVLAILSTSAAVFLRGPISSYFDAERRADLSDAGGLTMAKMSQEVSHAVPNSVRVVSIAGGGFYLEFLPVHSTNGVYSEGRYRSTPPGPSLNDGSNSFDALGYPVTVAAGSMIVVNSHLGSVWIGNNPGVRAAGVAGVGNPVRYAPHIFQLDPNPNPEYRFQVADAPVTYACIPNAANPALGTLRRYSGYALQAAQPQNVAGAPLAAAPSKGLLAGGISACRATSFPGNLRHAQVVALALDFDNAGNRLDLYHVIRVETLP